MHPRTQHVIEWIAGIMLLVAFAFVVFFWQAHPSAPRSARETPLQALLPAGTPAPTAADYAAAQHGFNELVQVTDRGPQPTALAVKKGDTVRFTNLAANPIRIAAPDAKPGAPCKADAFDSCTQIGHGSYWEHAFMAAGSFIYSDGAGHTGSIIVQ